jgi:DNA-directed RNA polymerase subunit RPC12/RpoP
MAETAAEISRRLVANGVSVALQRRLLAHYDRLNSTEVDTRCPRCGERLVFESDHDSAGSLVARLECTDCGHCEVG